MRPTSTSTTATTPTTPLVQAGGLPSVPLAAAEPVDGRRAPPLSPGALGGMGARPEAAAFERPAPASVDDALRAVVRDELRRSLRSELEGALRDEFAAAVLRLTAPTSRAAAPEFISVKRAAQIASVRAATVRSWVEQGQLPAYRAGRLLRVRLDDLIAYLSRTDGGATERVDLDERATDILKRRQQRLTSEPV